MNQRKFINLLNLYLDGEIEPNDAAELEHEILSNPERRRIYSEYCRIQRATKLVYEQFRLAAEDQSDMGVGTVQQAIQLPPSGNRVAGLEAGSPFRRYLWWLGGVAAACAALAVSLRSFQTSPTSVAATEPVVAAPVVATTDQSQPEATKRVEKFAAPFAPAARTDPYVAEQPRVRSDPFALVSWPVEAQGAGVEPTPAEMSSSALHLDLPSTALDLNDSADRADRRDQRIFRGHAGGQATAPFEPTGYQIRR
jgi:anti-sigma factor RsiW